jgi:tight adherence protein B
MTTAGLVAAGLVFCCAGAAQVARRSAQALRMRRRLGARRSEPRPRSPRHRLLRPPQALAGALEDAAVAVDAERAWTVWLGGAGLACAAGALVGGPVLAVLGAGAAFAVPALVLRAQRGRSAARLEAALPGALEDVARGLRSGASLRQAVEETGLATPGALGDELRFAAAEADAGVGLVAALEALGERRPLSGVRLATAALCLGAETGGAQARAVDGVAATLRERLAVTGEVRALSAQTRASMLLIALAPIAFCAFASATDPRTSTFLFRSPVGLACLVSGLALDGVGVLWMRRLSRVET